MGHIFSAVSNVSWVTQTINGNNLMENTMKGHNRKVDRERLAVEWGLLGALLVALAVKLWLVFSGNIPFNADEAVVGLMARHIEAGARPIFFYGQAYMGSLDAFFVASGFGIFGEQIWVIRLVQVVLYLLTIVTTAWLGRVVFSSWSAGVLAAWFLAIPPVNVALYTTASLGNYGEALLLGNLSLIVGLRIATRLRAGVAGPWWLWGIWGMLTGLGVWTFGLTLIYNIPVGAVLLWLVGRNWFRDSRDNRTELKNGLSATASGLILGASPWLVFAWKADPGLLLRELGSGGIAGVEGLTWFGSIWQHTLNLSVLGSTVIFGLRPPWSVQWLAWPLLPFALAFWLGVIGFIGWKLSMNQPRRFEAFMLVSIGLTLIAGFILTPFGADPSGRYFLPLYILLALFAAAFVLFLRDRIGIWAIGLPFLIMGFNLWGIVQSTQQDPPGLTTQFDAVTQIDHAYDVELIQFLQDNHEFYGYSNYWVAYPLAFRSAENLIFIPRLPYHPDFRYTSRDDRYPHYGELVQEADRVAYITTNHAGLDAYLRENLTGRSISWREKRIGDYNVFYGLSAKVTPEEMGLGR